MTLRKWYVLKNIHKPILLVEVPKKGNGWGMHTANSSQNCWRKVSLRHNCTFTFLVMLVVVKTAQTLGPDLNLQLCSVRTSILLTCSSSLPWCHYGWFLNRKSINWKTIIFLSLVLCGPFRLSTCKFDGSQIVLYNLKDLKMKWIWIIKDIVHTYEQGQYGCYQLE